VLSLQQPSRPVLEQVVPDVAPLLWQLWSNADTSEAGTCVIVQVMVEPVVTVHETGLVPVPPELEPEPPPELLPLLLPEPEPLPPPLLDPLHWLLQAVQALAWLERQELQSELTLL
jgi:hypothetical protein